MRGETKRTKVKVSKIAGLTNDLALALAARSVRIEAPIPGTSYVGIEVPNTESNNVGLKELMESEEFETVQARGQPGDRFGRGRAGQAGDHRPDADAPSADRRRHRNRQVRLY